jgi:hypothetical protein
VKLDPRLLFVALLACSKHDPELTRRQDPDAGDIDTASDARAPIVGSGADEDVTWCQALGVLKSSCQRCHVDPPLNGAPMALLTYEDTQAQWFTTEFKTWERMQDAVAGEFMPATFVELDPPVMKLSCAEKTTLLGWLEQGAKLVGPENCTDADFTVLECGLGGAGGAGNATP